MLSLVLFTALSLAPSTVFGIIGTQKIFVGSINEYTNQRTVRTSPEAGVWTRRFLQGKSHTRASRETRNTVAILGWMGFIRGR